MERSLAYDGVSFFLPVDMCTYILPQFLGVQQFDRLICAYLYCNGSLPEKAIRQNEVCEETDG